MAGAIQSNRLHSELFTSEPSTSCPENSGAEWEQMTQTRGASHNICVDGKLYPEFYSLGPPKTASTSMATDLAGAGFECAGAKKEWGFWFLQSVLYVGEDTELTEKKFRKHMPQCPGSERRLIADFAPQNLITSSVVPPVMKSLYGTNSRRITFMVMPREPLSLVQSFYYYTHSVNNIPVSTGMFQKEVRRYLKVLNENSSSITWNGNPQSFEALDFREFIDDFVPFAMIGSQLKEWLESFGPEQFIVAPLMAYVKDPKQVCDVIAKKINYDIGCTDNITHSISTEHPDLDTDLSHDLANEFKGYMNPDRKLLLELLEDGHRNGMTLPLYEGGPLDEWLCAYW